MSMQPYELDAWLGDARDIMTDEQVASFARLVDRIGDRWPDDVAERTEAMRGALQIILGDATLAEVGRDLRRVRVAEREAAARLTGALLAGAAAGIAETVMAEESGVSRPTVRKALGK